MLYERRLFYKIFFLQVSLFSPVLAQESPVFSLVAQALLPDFDFPCIFDLRFLCFSSPFFHVCFESIVHSHHSAQTQIQKNNLFLGKSAPPEVRCSAIKVHVTMQVISNSSIIPDASRSGSLTALGESQLKSPMMGRHQQSEGQWQQTLHMDVDHLQSTN